MVEGPEAPGSLEAYNAFSVTATIELKFSTTTCRDVPNGGLGFRPAAPCGHGRPASAARLDAQARGEGVATLRDAQADVPSA